MRILSCCLLFLCFITSCNQSDKVGKAKPVPRDTTITVNNSFSPKFLDSSSLETFITTQQTNDSVAMRLREFYARRNYQYAWFTDTAFAEYGQGFATMLDNYIFYSKDSTIYNKELHALVDSITADPRPVLSNADMQKTELLLSTQFFRYAYRVYQGRNSIDQKDLGWFIPKRKIDPVALLDSLIVSTGGKFDKNEPLNPQYNLLKDKLVSYYSVQRSLDSLPVIEPLTTLKTMDSAGRQALKKRLFLLGDLATLETGSNNNDSLVPALKNFQSRHGLTLTGTLDKATINCLNVTSESRIRQMLINLERLKWVPVQSTGDYILVNIPEFRLHLYEKGSYKWSMNVVVGSDANSTVIFMGNLKYVVFSPYWNIPTSIIKKEVMPGISRNRNYLAQHNMEWNGGQIRQKPGPKNSLGLVKFLFPNSYNIYLHDTPSKSLFNDSKRAFSHGCIRLAEPTKLAEFLLRNDTAWSTNKIDEAMHAGKEKYVTLKDMIPVYISYFTSWVDRKGMLNFRDDIYGHDKKMAEKLFLK